MASTSSSAPPPPPPPPPVSRPGRPSSSSSSSSGSGSASSPGSFLFRRRRFPRFLTPSPSKKPRVSPKPQLIGPLSFSDFFQKEFTPVMRDLFNTLGVLHFVAQHCPTGPSFQTNEILRSLEYITDKCADEVLSFFSTSDDSQYTITLSPAFIEPAPPDRPELHPDLDDVWEWTGGPLRQLEDVLMNGYEKLSQAELKITKMQATTRPWDTLQLLTYPQMARNLNKAASSFEAMYNVVRRQIELEIVEAHKDGADVLTDPAGDGDPPVSS